MILGTVKAKVPCTGLDKGGREGDAQDLHWLVLSTAPGSLFGLPLCTCSSWGRHTSYGNCQATAPGLPQLKVITEPAAH